MQVIFLFYFLFTIVTRNCGPGEITIWPKKFSLFPKINICCELHDKCPISVEPGQTLHGVYNYYFFTISDCKCDRVFTLCLKNINGWTANAIDFGYKKIVPICIELILMYDDTLRSCRTTITC